MRMSETNNAAADDDEFVYNPDDWDPTKAHLQFQAFKSANQGGGTPLQEWHVETQTASKVAKKGGSDFREHIGACATTIVAFCADNTVMKPGGGFGSQFTLMDFGDTVTMDFQGLRENSGRNWFDFQGQKGKGSARNTYFQVMVLQEGGDGPSAAMIEQAIRESLKGGARSIVVLQSVQARPK
jgi:hypothetical protein